MRHAVLVVSMWLAVGLSRVMAQPALETRQWRAGGFVERGTLVSLIDNVVTIRSASGEELQVALSDLSKEDQKYVLNSRVPSKSPFRRKPDVSDVSRTPPTVTTNSIGIRLIKIPAGEFEMGSDASRTAHSWEAKPVHRVRITKAFLLGQTEVTQGQWKKVMDFVPWEREAYVNEGPEVAATHVCWDHASQFCEQLTKLERSAGRLRDKVRYRLPTEAEWEYACRAGTTTRFSFGDDEERLGEYAWFDKNAWDCGEKYAHPVGHKKPNPWGLHDMHGNLMEWCSDFYSTKYYADSPEADPQGPPFAPFHHRSIGDGSGRVCRGGYWGSEAAGCETAFRSNIAPPQRLVYYGFRVVCELE